MIVYTENSAIVAEKITHWDVWSYSDFPCVEHPEGWLQVYLEAHNNPVTLWIGSKLLAREFLLILPAWVDGHLKAGTAEIDLGRQIKILLAAGVDGWHPTEEETKDNAPTNREE